MARQPRYVPLNVYLNSRLVGQLRRDPAGAIAFQYDAGWLAWQHALPVSLSLPLREAAYTGTPVLAVFENLLPDNVELRRRIATRTQAEGTDAYSLLNVIGRDCVGALQFLPPDIQPGRAGAINGAPISKGEISALLANLATSPLGIGEDKEFRISIAGAQEKTALLEPALIQASRNHCNNSHFQTVNRTAPQRSRPDPKRQKRIFVPETACCYRSACRRGTDGDLWRASCPDCGTVRSAVDKGWALTAFAPGGLLPGPFCRSVSQV